MPVSIVSIGDNLVDRYQHLHKYYPGGNALNVAVFAQRYGAQASFIGGIGDDPPGQHICQVLKREDVDISHVQIFPAPTRYATVQLVDGERTFLKGGNRETNKMLRLGSEDFDFINQFDLIHTSINSYLEEDLPSLGKLEPKISFDYSDTYDQEYLDRTLPYVDYAIFSINQESAKKIKDFQREISKKNTELVLVTRGIAGAIAYQNSRFYQQDANKVEVIDTLGCGDSFIASFLVNSISGSGMSECLEKAANDAAETSSYYGAFGYGVNY